MFWRGLGAIFWRRYHRSNLNGVDGGEASEKKCRAARAYRVWRGSGRENNSCDALFAGAAHRKYLRNNGKFFGKQRMAALLKAALERAISCITYSSI